MDLATIAGLILGVAILALSLLIGGVPIQTLVQPEAIMIVIGGTLAASLVNFSFEEIQNAFKALFWVFHEEDLVPEDVLDYITDAAIYIRTKGLLAVQPLLDHVDIPFLQNGLQMIIDNQPTEHICSKLTTELEVQYQAGIQYSRVFEAAGGFSPTMGIIGAIIGLVHVMTMLNTPDQLGSAIASAFMATLYGVGLANIFFLPIAGKLRYRAKEEWMLKSMMLQGILAIREGQHPTLIREQLQAYLGTEGTQEQESFETEETAYPNMVRV